MILLLLYLALLASIGAASVIPVPHDDRTQLRNIVEEPALFKRADGEELSYMKYLLDQAASIPQPSFAPASQYHGHGLFHDESDAFQGNQGISHHHFNAQDPVRFHTSHHQRYSQVVPRSHNAFNEPYGEGTDEIYRLHNQSYIQDLAGSHDSHYQHPSSTLDPSWSRGSPWYPYDQRTSEYSHLQHPSHVQNPPQVYDNSFHHQPNTQGTSWSHGTHFFSYGQRFSEDLHLQHPSHVQEPRRFHDNSFQHQLDTQGPSSSHGSFLDSYGPGSSENSHFQHPSHGHGPHGSYSKQAYLYFEGSPELDDLVKQHLAHYWMSRMSHPQIDEQQSQTHAGLGSPGSLRHPPSAGEHAAFRPDGKSPSEGHVSGETSDPDVKSDRKTNWKVAKPKKPGPSATRKQVKIALIYYLRAQDVVATGNEGLLNLSEEDKKAMGYDGELFYQKICDCRGGRVRNIQQTEEAHLSVKHSSLLHSMSTKISGIKHGEKTNRSGVNWSIEDVRNLKRLARGPLKNTSLTLRFAEIGHIVKDCWEREQKALTKLYQNPWGENPVDFILRNYPFLQSLLPPSLPPPFHQ